MKNNVKLILFDMDGTLLSSEKKLPAEFEEVFHALQAQGITLGIASGRPLANLQAHFPNIDQEMVYVCENGGLVAYKDKIISINTVPNSLVQKTIKKARTINHCSLLLCAKDATYYEDENDLLLQAARKYYPTLIKVDRLEEVEDACLKMTLYDYDDSSSNTYPAFQHIDQALVAASSAKEWCDINHAYTSKATGAKQLLDYMHLTFDQLMVFGDEGNDFEILKAAKYSVAMKNAIPRIKEVCAYECDSNDQNGVIKMLKETFL